MIQKPSSLAAKEKKVRILIAGYPGIGKSTLGLSSPAPLHIDVDRGADRVEARYRAPFIQPENYEELLSDLSRENLALNDFQTLVFDTGGQLLHLMKPWAIRQNGQNGQRDGTLSMKGYGAVGREFERLMNYCYYELNKHIVVLFHAKEEKDGDSTRMRILVEGQTKDNVWQPMDLGGFMRSYDRDGNDRRIGFSNCDQYFAKGTHGISGILKIPALTKDSKNDYLTNLFTQVNEHIAAEGEVFEGEKQAYDQAIKEAKEIIDNITSPETANMASDQLAVIQNVLTSKKETRKMFTAKIKELGIVFNKEKATYESAN
jgi:hypothetical protein